MTTVFERHGYLLDPHTAVAYQAAEQSPNHCLVVATASPFKFPETSLAAIDPKTKELNLEEMMIRLSQLTSLPIPSRLKALLKEDGVSKKRIRVDDINHIVKEILNYES